MEINPDFFVTRELDFGTAKGYTFTLTSRLGHILTQAEGMFGKRDKEYTILGVEFNLLLRPQIWFPGDCKHIVIQLNQLALTEFKQALYQLSHEIIHCISPAGMKITNVLEEGMATYFSEWYMRNNNMGEWPALSLNGIDSEYNEASALVKSLLTFSPNIIKDVREFQPVIARITPKDLLKADHTIPFELAEKLCKPFKY